jgi:localization factor PodJL
MTTTGEPDTRPQFEEQPAAQQPLSSRRERSFSKLVIRAQEKLRELGYEPGPVDGVLGPRTKQALSNFQRDQDLPLTGTLSPATRRQLLGT